MKGLIPFIIFCESLLLLGEFGDIQGGEVSATVRCSFETSSEQKTTAGLKLKGEKTSGIITVDEALEAALKFNPGLEAARQNIESFNGVIKQAGALPNPYLSGEFEEFGGTGEFSGTGAMSSRIGVSQEIPVAGQPARRVKVASVQKSIAESEYSAQILALRNEIKKRFLRVYILQEQLKLEEENLNILSSLKEGIVKRVTAGEASPLDELKVTVQLEIAAIAAEQTRREQKSAKYLLASSWAEDEPQFERVKYLSDEDFTIPDEQNLLEQLRSNPSCSVLGKKVLLASSSLDLARSEAWMDIEVGGGIQRFNETDDHAYFLEVSIPLPIFNRNRGNIEEAVHLKSKAQKEFEDGYIKLRAGLRELLNRLQSVKRAFASMQKTVMPAAEKAFESVKKAYDAGEADYLELLEAQRTYLETRHQHLELFNELQELKIELETYMTEDNQEK